MFLFEFYFYSLMIRNRMISSHQLVFFFTKAGVFSEVAGNKQMTKAVSKHPSEQDNLGF